ncbi:chromatin modification-related protein EAF7-domain-containing protein [Umbelopsis sp. PMI_123]|nr:chromatin modification-related protein EAF7-domain-containing protein [Umbelopsis sp. PMI_123]
MSEVDYVKRESEDVLNADHFESEESDWQAQKELALLNAISKCKPVGMHKHFRIISIQRQFNQDNSTPLTIEEIWRELEHLYGIEALNELMGFNLQEEADEEDDMDIDQPGVGVSEFTLPMDDYEQLIFEHRQDDQSSRQGSTSPTITPVKKKATRKESSPTSSITGSNASTPEPEEAKKGRRSRAKRSDATPEPASKATMGRRSTRGSAAPRGGRKTKKK